MRTVAISSIDVKVCTQKSNSTQGNFLRYLTQPKIIRQIPFELTDIEYDQIKDEIERMERVISNTDIVINVMIIDDIYISPNF